MSMVRNRKVGVAVVELRDEQSMNKNTKTNFVKKMSHLSNSVKLEKKHVPATEGVG